MHTFGCASADIGGVKMNSLVIAVAIILYSAVANLPVKGSGNTVKCTCNHKGAHHLYNCSEPAAGYCIGIACLAFQRTKSDRVERICLMDSKSPEYFILCHNSQSSSWAGAIFWSYCCQSHSFCSDEIHPTTTHQGNNSDLRLHWTYIGAIASIVAIVIVVIVFFALACHCPPERNRGGHHSSPSWQAAAMSAEDDESQSMFTSGRGRPMLIKQTIARQLTWVKVIGQGTFGQVWHCTFQGMDVAVKSCTIEDDTWKKESLIYQTTMLRHENVLAFRAADIYDSEGVTKMLLITDYHPRGSLFSFLHDNVLSIQKVLTLASSAVCGLNHLHSFILGTNSKPAIVHRDLKSKNVLVKENGEACICDLGLAVMYNPQEEHSENFKVSKIQVGTRRYMAPEVLSEKISPVLFEGFKMADIYAFGLLLWEMLSRCQLYDGRDVAEYHEPYYDMVPADPSIEQMLYAVVTLDARPKIQDNWCQHPKSHPCEMVSVWFEAAPFHNMDESKASNAGFNPTTDISIMMVAREIASVMTTCWKRLPQSRLSALRLWKSLNALRERFMMSGDSASATRTPAPRLAISSSAVTVHGAMSSSHGVENVVFMETGV